MIIESLLHLFEHYAHELPLHLFVPIGGFIEEVISPIPSFVVMLPAGVAAQVQGVAWWYLPVLGLLGGLGHTLGSMVLYGLADKIEDWVLGRRRKFFGFSHTQVERYGKKFSGKPKDFVLLFALNALPVVPTALLSLACGFIKINFRMFVAATFLGATINATIYLGVGYAGVEAISRLRGVESVFEVVSIVLVALAFCWLMYYLHAKKKRGR
jgi:membrane protein DedA with SNARE-associated domain